MEEISKGIELSKLVAETAMLLKHNMMKGFEDLGITAPQGMVLKIISKQPQVKISELSEKLGLSNSTVSGVVDRLEKQGYVMRIRSQEDRRVVYVRLSPEFANLHKDFHARSEKNLEDLMSKATPEELEKITVGLHILKQLIEREGKK
jgi:DNA-binding MarR family transcriptional regulator